MPDIEIKRSYEVLPDNNVRFGIRVINDSDSAISDVEVLLDYSESLFELEGNKVQKLGNIPPTVPRTAKFILKPLGCVHKEEIGATVLYKDHQWKKHTVEMRPKEVHCVCPFLKEKSITRADFLRLSNSGSLEERGVNFDGITVDKLVDFIGHTCKNRLYKVDEFPIENGKILYLAGDALGEKAYYLLTAVVKEYEGLTQVLLRASSDKSHGLNGFLNEILDNIRHLVLSASAREIGIIKKEQVINIIDSVVQRSTISMEEGAPSIKIKDSMVQRTEIKGDEERGRMEEEEQDQIQKAEDGLEVLKQKREELKREREKLEKKKQLDELEAKKKKTIEEEREKLRKQIQEDEEPLRKMQEEERRKEDLKNIWENSKKIITIRTTKLEKTKKEIENSGFLGFGKKKELVDVFVEKEVENQVEVRENSIGMKFTLITAGEFMLGSNRYFEDFEGKGHRVKIRKPFYLGTYPVTQKEWKSVMGNNPSFFKGDNLPVETVSWNDVQEFIKKLNEKEGSNKYRLPEGMEWEYAARAGTTTICPFGDDESKLGDYAWYCENSGSRPPKKGDCHGYDEDDYLSLKWNGKTHNVGQKKPNPWGLYDMLGNVWEWDQDKWVFNYTGPPTDESSWEKEGRCQRGGCFGDFAEDCCLNFYDGHGNPNSGNKFTGFRLLRVL